MEAQTLLVIILSTALAIFIILAIVLVVMLIKVIKNVRNVTAQAENMVNNMANVSQMVRKNIQPVAISAGIMKFINKLIDTKDSKKKED